MKFIPLRREDKLFKLNEQNFIGEFFFEGGKNFFIALFNFAVPFNPVRAAVFLFNRREQCIIFQPITLRGTEFFKIFFKIGVVAEFGFEIVERLFKSRVLEFGDAFKIYANSFSEPRRDFNIVFVEEPVFNQRVD